MHHRKILLLLIGLGTLPTMPALAVNPPQWDEFSKGEYLDTANVKADGAVVSAYAKHADAGKQVTTLYEVDCKRDLIRVHSDTQRYRAVPVEGGGSVIQADDGFRTVVPGTRNAQLETAICGVVTKREMEGTKQEQQAECERAKHDDEFRVLFAKDQLSRDESMCLLGLTRGDRYEECGKSGIPAGTNVADYLRNKGIALPCESAPATR